MPLIAGSKLLSSDLSIPETITGSMSTSALTDGAAAATVNPITDPYGSGGSTPFELHISGLVLATIVTTERWDLQIESPINTTVARIRGYEEATTQMVFLIPRVVVPRSSGASTSVRFIMDRASGSGTCTPDANAVYNQYHITFNRMPP